MKLNSKLLKTALAHVGKVARGRTTLPALSCVKLSCVPGDQLQLECTNLDAWITRRIDCAGGIEPVLVNYPLLSRVLENVTAETLEISNHKDGLYVTAGDSFSKLNTMDVREWPDSPNEKGVTIGVVANDLADGLEAVAWAAEKSSTASNFKLALTVDLKPTSLICAATRGTIMAIFNRPLICEERRIIMPAAFAHYLAPDMREKDAVVKTTNNLLSVQHAKGSAAIKLSEYPAYNYQQALELRGKEKGTPIPKETLIRMCHLAVAFEGMDKTPTLKAERDGDSIKFSTKGHNGERDESITAIGAALEFKLNAALLLEGLNTLDSDTVAVTTLNNGAFFEVGDTLIGVSQLGKVNQK